MYIKNENTGKLILRADCNLPLEIKKELAVEDRKEYHAGILTEELKPFMRRGMGTYIAQLYEIVVPGLILAKRCFKGLERGMYVHDEMNNGEKHFVYSWKPSFDISYSGPPSHKISRIKPPDHQVFVVLCCSNDKYKEKYPEIDAWLNHWSWVHEDSYLSLAPINWFDRYGERFEDLY